MRKLTGGHAKSATEFYHLETNTWKLRHHISYLRIMYHQEILKRDTNETINKIYLKQKDSPVKGDWLNLLKEDFNFIGTEINEEEIIATPKATYKKKIKQLINKAVFQYLMNLKQGHSKLNDVEYTIFQLQPYMATKTMTNEEKELLFNLRSKCHSSQANFRKMHRNNLKCIFNCPDNEDQMHSFTKCRPILSRIDNAYSVKYENIFGTLQDQKHTIQVF